MKKNLLLLVLISMMAMMLCACDDNGIQINEDGTLSSTKKPMEKGTANVTTQHKGGSNTEITESAPPEASQTEGVDLDLTKMDSSMIYATVYQIMTKPNDYVGKVIRAKGAYSPTFYEPDQSYYHYVVIKDATACCQTGLEFVWGDDSHKYPDEYPKEGDEIIVTGTFQIYQDEGDPKYYGHLLNSTMEVEKKD